MIAVGEDPGAIVNRRRGSQRGGLGRQNRRIRSREFGDGIGQVQIAGEASVGVLHGGVVFVAQAQVQSEPLAQFEIVLKE